MDRRKFLATIPAGVAAAKSMAAEAKAPGAMARASAGQQMAAGSEKPNFLFFIADDLTFNSIASLNNKELHTPNFDRLSARGCTFTHCFHQGSWSGAVCIPSRTMLNTGLSAFRAQTQSHDVNTWGQTLATAGYETYICGKWHLDEVMVGRSFRQMDLVAPGFLESTPEGGMAYDRPSPGNTWDPADPKWKGHWVPTQLWKDARPGQIEHADAVYADTAINHLKNKAAHSSDPFFMYIGFNSPHDPRQSPQEFLDMYPQDKIEIPPNYLPVHPFDQGDAHVRDEMLAPFPRTKEAVQLHRREYYALITYMDSQIGRVMDALEESGKAANTYVILTADHGLAVGQHGLMGKQNLYECSVRMPLLIAGPGIEAGRKVDRMVYQHSMFATTCELAGAPVPKTVEFPSLVPLLHGGDAVLHDAMYCRYIDFQRSVRTEKYKLIVYPKVNVVQIFDLAEDPWETRNLANEPSLAGVRKDLFARLKQLQLQVGDPLRLTQS